MTEEFNESMINDIKEGDKVTGEVQQVEDKQVVVHINGGKFNGIIPISQLSTHHIDSPSEVVKEGDEVEAYVTKVEELDPENNRVILSRKAVEQEENDAKKDQLLQSLNEGDVIDGKVARLTQFGAFIDIGGVDGLVHVSELSHEHVQTPEEVVSIGQDVKVKIKSIDRDTERISLSIKDTLPTPFENIKGQFHENDVIEGVVVRLANFGAFVEIAPGVQGLVHISEIAHKHIGTPGEVLEPGQQVNVKILGIDEENERVSLSIKATLPNEDVVESDPSTTKAYLESEEEDNPTIGDMIGDKLKNLKL